MILITGGTGLLGAHLLFKCSKSKLKLRAIYRREEKLKEIKLFFKKFAPKNYQKYYERIEWLKTDLNDLGGLNLAFKDVEKVYHCAAKVSLAYFQKDKLLKTNVEGTANIVNLCIKYKVKKIVYVSSIAALGAEKNLKKVNETHNWYENQNYTPYAYSKFAAELEVWRGAQEGLDTVIVNPGVIIGYHLTSKSINTIFKRVKRGILFYPIGKIGLVDVKDVVKVIIFLMNSSIKSKRFILVSENLSQKEFIEKIASGMNKKKTRFALSRRLLITLLIAEKTLSIMRLKKSFLSLALIDTLCSQQEYDGSKIEKEIDFNYNSIDNTLKRYFNIN